MSKLAEWWASQSPEKQREIDKRAAKLKPNEDLYGKPKPKPAHQPKPK